MATFGFQRAVLDGCHQKKAQLGIDTGVLDAKLRFAHPGILDLPVTTVQTQGSRVGHLGDLNNSDERGQETFGVGSNHQALALRMVVSCYGHNGGVDEINGLEVAQTNVIHIISLAS